MKKLSYPALFPIQSEKIPVFVFVAKASEIFSFATIDRIGRDKQGKLSGFQRPQLASHIAEIAEYLAEENSVLPNSIVVGFLGNLEFDKNEDKTGTIRIEFDDSTLPGLVVDGQQRLSALSELPEKDFDVFVTGFLCNDESKLAELFWRLNNTRPVPKPLLYELFPYIKDLPTRLTNRATASQLVEVLNFREGSSLKGLIKQQTNPTGFISDIAVQRFITESLSEGLLRELFMKEDGLEESYKIINAFFHAVSQVFHESWVDHTPRTSRLVHGAGIVSMGWVFEYLNSTENATTSDQFASGLALIKERTFWTSGVWKFSEEEIRPWNSIQNVPKDYRLLTDYLIRELRIAQKKRKSDEQR